MGQSSINKQFSIAIFHFYCHVSFLEGNFACFLSIFLAGGHQKRFRLVESPHGWNSSATSCHLFARYFLA